MTSSSGLARFTPGFLAMAGAGAAAGVSSGANGLSGSSPGIFAARSVASPGLAPRLALVLLLGRVDFDDGGGRGGLDEPGALHRELDAVDRGDREDQGED